MREFHPAAAIFELLEGEDLDNLVADIEKHGLLTPIWLHSDGRVLDGRNRAVACKRLGIEPETQTWDGKGSAADFVHSLNYVRRHLEGNALLVAAANYAIELEKEAAARQKSGLKIGDSPSSAIEDNGKRGRSHEIAAQKFGAKAGSVERAVVVRKKAIPELAEKFGRDEVSASAAAIVAKLPEAEQQAIVDQGPIAIVKAATEARESAQIDKESWAADVLRGINTHDSARDFIKGQLGAVVRADDGYRDIARDLGTALDFLEGVIGDVVEDMRGDEDLLTKISRAA